MKKINTFLGQKTSSFQRNYPYSIKPKILQFQPIPVNRSERLLLIFITPKQVYDGLWAAWSWLKFLSKYNFDLWVFVDGEVNEEILAKYQYLFPNIQVISAPEFLRALKLPEDFKSYGLEHRFGRIHTIRLELQKSYELVYSDCDVLVFREPEEIIKSFTGGDKVPLFNLDSSSCIDDPWIIEKLKKLNLQLIPRFNAGLMYIPQGSMDIELAYNLLEGWPEIKGNPMGYHTGQTLFNGLMNKAGARPLPSNYYLCNSDGMWFWQKDTTDYDKIITRHFVGNVRHQMYLAGMPYIYKQQILQK